MKPSSANTPQPLDALLPRVDPAVAAASRVLHNRQLRAGFRQVLGGVEFRPMTGRPSDVRRVSLQTVYGPVEACFSAPDFPSVNVAAVRAAAVPAALQQLAAEALMQPLLEVLGAFGMTDVTVVDLSTLDSRIDQVPSTGWVRLRRDGQPVLSFVCTRLPDEVLHEVAQLLRPPEFVSRLSRVLTTRGQVTLTTRTVRRNVLASLDIGDVLLLASGADEQRVDCRVSFGARGARRWTAAATVDETSLTIQGAGQMTDEEHEYEAQPDEKPVDAGSRPPQDLEVSVRFEIDTVAIPLAEIEAMGQGYVIELATPLSTARIKLVSCGRVIGTADLVAVGDRLGARITQMGSRHASRHIN